MTTLPQTASEVWAQLVADPPIDAWLAIELLMDAWGCDRERVVRELHEAAAEWLFMKSPDAYWPRGDEFISECIRDGKFETATERVGRMRDYYERDFPEDAAEAPNRPAYFALVASVIGILRAFQACP